MNDKARSCETPLNNPHRSTPEVHFRLYIGNDGVPTTICVQDFDYQWYWAENLLTEDAYGTEPEAQAALNALLTARVESPEFPAAARTARILAASGIPLTRQQAVDASLAVGLAEVDNS